MTLASGEPVDRDFNGRGVAAGSPRRAVVAGGRRPAVVGLLYLMSDQDDALEPGDALDELVTQLLGCSGVLSQMINHMVQFQASGRSASDTAPIPTVAHTLIRSAILKPMERRPEGEIRAAAVIIEEVMNAICEEIFIVGPSLNSSVSRASSVRRRRRRRP
jgi:hypothetical protein